MSKFSNRLVEAARTSADPVRGLIAKAQLALYVARLDWIVRARDLLKEVRASALYSAYPAIAAYLNLAEAVIASRSANFSQARACAVRAHAISTLGGNTFSETAAWLAHFNQLLRDDKPAISNLLEAFRRLRGNDYAAAFRACLSLSEFLHLADRFDLARSWYSYARRCAEKSGDDVSTAELIYNIAAYGIENTRLLEIEGKLNGFQVEFFRVQAESAFNYSNLIGVRGEEWQFDLLFVGVHYLEGRYAAMMRSCEGVSHRDLEKDKPGIGISCRLDHSFGALKISRVTPTQALIDSAILSLKRTSANEELALVNFQLHKIFNEMGDERASNSYLSTAMHQLSLHREYQADLLLRIQEARLVETATDSVRSLLSMRE